MRRGLGACPPGRTLQVRQQRRLGLRFAGGQRHAGAEHDEGSEESNVGESHQGPVQQGVEGACVTPDAGTPPTCVSQNYDC
ncbi:MAG: hypothetical protein IPG81_00090 [Sandaracinaceae bacterium]|nr:hypothetical protein [Sandaracinaceae bacterium]